MKQSFVFAAAFAALSLTAVLPASSAPLSSAPADVMSVATGQSLIEEAQYRRGRYVSYCQRQRFACAASYPSRGWRYRRCVSARGCL